jgi:spoIIIJ-associated protein
MKTVELTGRTVEEALLAAQKELGLETAADLRYEVLEEASKGFLGLLGGNPARIRAWVKENPQRLAYDFLADIFARMGLDVEMKTSEKNGYLQIDVSGDDLGILIGRRGRTLDALQYLTNLAANRQSRDRVGIIVDIGGYRQRRARTLERLAERIIKKVKSQRQCVVLEPMTPQERRVIHLVVQKEKGVTSYSEGSEPYRKVIIDLEK